MSAWGPPALAALLLVGRADAQVLARRTALSAPREEIVVSGGTAALLRAAGVTVPVDPPRALLVVARTVHGPFAPSPKRSWADAFRDAVRAANGRAADRVPGLLPLAVWQRAVFGRDVQPHELAMAIAADRRASFLYWGLFSLDEETLAFFASHPDLVREVYRRSADVFAAYADGLHVTGGRLRIPGGDTAAAAWRAATNAAPDDAARFLPALLARDEGRLAQLLGALGRLDPPHVAYALGPSARDLPALIASASRFDATVQLPFVAWSAVDVPFLLEHVRVTPDGHLAPPSGRWFWDAAFNGQPAAGAPGPGELTAPLLVDLFAPLSRDDRRARLDALLFAQRRFAARLASGTAGAGAPGAWLETASSFPRVPALFLTLEQIGSAEPADYEAGAAGARALAAAPDPSTATRRIAALQAVLALLAGCTRAGSLAPPVAQGLASDVLRAASGPADEFAGAALATVRELLSCLPAPAASTGAEGHLLEGLAGAGVSREAPVIEWEGRSYRVDPARAEHARLEEVRAQQGGWSLDAVLALDRLLADLDAVPAGPEAAREATAAILAGAARPGEGREQRLFGFRVDGLLDATRAAAVEIGRDPARALAPEQRARLSTGLEVMAADTLVALVYATRLDPEAPLVQGDSLGRRHDFGLTGAQERAWTLPGLADLAAGRVVRGSLLGLERCLARETLRPTMIGLPPAAPTLTSDEARALAESTLALNPWNLADRDAAQVAEALRRGRARVEAAAGEAQALEALLAGAGLDGIRRRLALLAAGDTLDGVLDQLSLAEVLALGREGGPPLPEAVVERWGPAARVVDGSFGQWMPRRLGWPERSGRPGGGLLAGQYADLALRTAEWLSDRRLPAMLAPGILSLAAWDLTMRVQVAHLDDWLPVIRAARAVPDDRFEDYVSALVARGPLVPVDAK